MRWPLEEIAYALSEKRERVEGGAGVRASMRVVRLSIAMKDYEIVRVSVTIIVRA